MLNHLDCHILLTPSQIQAWYRGQVKQVVTESIDGISIQLPIRHLKPYFEHRGLQGFFRVVFTSEGAFVSIERL